MNQINRRDFIKKTSAASLATVAVPTIVPSRVFGKNAPSNRINIAAIGTGRISRIMDMPQVLAHDDVQLVAVCDLDAKRALEGAQLVNNHYFKKHGKAYIEPAQYTDYRELLNKDDIDAVLISTPDHWHAKLGVDFARAGKDIFMQKPASLTIEEGRFLSDVVQKSGVIFQIGSQQRSSHQWRFAAEIVRNGRIGELKKVYVGLPGDPAGEEEHELPIPENLNYDMWLGSTPEAYYTEKRVHPQVGYGRPGWLRCRQFGAGMITGWGAHHIDSAHWGMNTELTGPIEIWGDAEFPSSGLWNVHGEFKTHGLYENGVEMIVSNTAPNGVKFEGTEGWVFVTRGDYKVTASDPVANEEGVKPLDASNPSIINSPIDPNGIHLPVSENHHRNWLDAIKSREQPIAPVEEAHRSCSACLLHHIAMKLDRKLYWNPKKEKFKNDKEANALLSLEQREPYKLV
ncbi:putative dehydrogenase [Saonia flava]|uniref:Putative dehydrogenase n=1 Tax=Saonia flava TaxID=523696 RepID=A0A846QPA7_9FLAO|nr:Gfo/Idh/MocA family oxidoreductase [Saonia flava]NJB69938.1 putative dehydrogenase [Saonia flava]